VVQQQQSIEVSDCSLTEEKETRIFKRKNNIKSRGETRLEKARCVEVPREE
jgi:hypothetical protein